MYKKLIPAGVEPTSTLLLLKVSSAYTVYKTMFIMLRQFHSWIFMRLAHLRGSGSIKTLFS